MKRNNLVHSCRNTYQNFPMITQTNLSKNQTCHNKGVLRSLSIR